MNHRLAGRQNPTTRLGRIRPIAGLARLDAVLLVNDEATVFEMTKMLGAAITHVDDVRIV